MSEFHVTLYGDDSEAAEEFKERADEELAGGVNANSHAMRVAIDLAKERLEADDTR